MAAHNDSGRRAELTAANYLERHKFNIVGMNWRTRYCEIDIIAERRGTICFCEVKYRQNANQGLGLDYITPKKLRQMKFAAEMWTSTNNWWGAYRLCAIEVVGSNFVVTRAIWNVT